MHTDLLTSEVCLILIIPFVLSEEQKRLKAELKGKNVSLIFDGTSRLGEALAIIVCFVGDEWKIEQHLVRLQLLVKLMTGEEIARELVNTLSVEYGVSSEQLLAAMQDWVSSNTVAMGTIKVLFPNMLDVGYVFRIL